MPEEVVPEEVPDQPLEGWTWVDEDGEEHWVPECGDEHESESD